MSWLGGGERYGWFDGGWEGGVWHWVEAGQDRRIVVVESRGGVVDGIYASEEDASTCDRVGRRGGLLL